MSHHPTSRPSVRARILASLAALSVTTALVGGCSAEAIGSLSATEDQANGSAATSGVFDSSTVHEIDVDFDDGALADVLTVYAETGEKEWATATVTIDGTTFEEVGIRLKGNSSLRGADTESEAAELPWLIDLDKNVDDQNLDGVDEFVVRSNNSETALNEAVALDLLREAGLAASEATPVAFSADGSDPTLRLVVSNLDGDWEDENFETDGVLYKAESTGDYSYRGDDPADYEDVFDQETGQDEDLQPLMDFLEFINESTDEEFAADLADHLDVQAFATYLAFEDLVGNEDDIDGPGNNSFLRYDETTGQMTVVAWDHNLAFGSMGMGRPGGAPGGVSGERPEGVPEGFVPPEGFDPPEGMEPPQGMELPEGFEPGAGRMPEGGNVPGRSNILVERFTANETFNALVEEAAAELQATLVDSGIAQGILDTWVTVLSEGASELVDVATIEEEASEVEDFLAGDTDVLENDEGDTNSGGTNG